MVALVVMLLFVAFVEAPFAPADLALPMNRICAVIARFRLD